MCGIAGISGDDRDGIERMLLALAHRGPDGRGIDCVPGRASLGHARLAILDPRPEGNQPMWNADRTVAIVFNGEIYNFRELRDAEGIRCRTETDTEVLLGLYERHGMEFVDRLRGMFAFGIFDTRTHDWHLARDASGIKPLFLSTTGGVLRFASEVRSLLAGMQAKPSLNMEALSQYLRLQYVPGPRTLVHGIEQLPPGTVLTWSQGKEERRSFTPHEDIQHDTPAESRAALPGLMQQAVDRHLVSDKPVGIFLSGGMDSSILLHHMAAGATNKIRTYTVRFDATEGEDAKRFNTDADLARMTAAHYGTDHTEILLTAEQFRASYRDCAKSLDLPNANPVAVAQYALAREAKKHVDVVLCGIGGDELFGGYPRYRIARILHTFRHVPAALRSAAARFTGYPADVLGMSPGPALAERLLARPASECADIARGTWFDPSATARLFTQRYAQNASDPVRAFMEFDRGLWLTDEALRLADGVTMASGVEGRVPFLDPLVIAAAHAVPSDAHVTLGSTKTLLKDAYRGILPDHLYTLPKASFFSPLAKWLRREAAPLVDEMLENKRMAELFDVDRLRALHAEHKQGAYHLHQLATAIQVSCWLDEVYGA